MSKSSRASRLYCTCIPYVLFHCLADEVTSGNGSSSSNSSNVNKTGSGQVFAKVPPGMWDRTHSVLFQLKIIFLFGRLFSLLPSCSYVAIYCFSVELQFCPSHIFYFLLPLKIDYNKWHGLEFTATTLCFQCWSMLFATHTHNIHDAIEFWLVFRSTMFFLHHSTFFFSFLLFLLK